MNLQSSPIEFLDAINGVDIWVKRDDMIDPLVSGNKLFKLVLNARQAKLEGKSGILTFGGAFSNHIAATARYCQTLGLNSIGIIRGELTTPLNSTLELAQSNGMQLIPISRTEYRQKTDANFLKALQEDHPDYFIVPEGGCNLQGIDGMETCLTNNTHSFDYIATAVGTGTTAAGLAKFAQSNQRILAFPIHKHGSVMDEIKALDPTYIDYASRISVVPDYHFGGYAKWTEELLKFIGDIHESYRLKLDPIYTSKALFGLMDQVNTGAVKKRSKVLFIHTGGLQGVPGFEARFGRTLFPREG